MGEGHLAETVTDQGLRVAVVGVVAGVFKQAHRQHRLAGIGQRVGQEDVIVLRQAEVAAVAQMGGGADALVCKG